MNKRLKEERQQAYVKNLVYAQNHLMFFDSFKNE